jgi:hypothetical protein
MPGSNKRSKSRQLFEEVFDQQTRRFSAFDLLGLNAEAKESTVDTSRKQKRQIPKKSTENDSLSQVLGPDRLSYVYRTDLEDAHAHVQSVARDSVSLSSPLFLRQLDPSLVTLPLGENPESEATEAIDSSQTGVLLEPLSSTLALGRDPQDLTRTVDTRRESESNPYAIRESTLEKQSAAVGKVQPWPEANNDQNAQDTNREKTTLQKEGETASQSGISNERAEAVPGSSETSLSAVQGARGEANFRRSLGTDRLGSVLGTDRLFSLGTVPSSLGQTVRPSLGQSPVKISRAKLGTDGLSQVKIKDGTPTQSTLLAPVQWNVWQALLTVETANAVTSYREIARLAKSTIEGVRKAIKVITKEGGIINKETVRTPQTQGFRVTLDRSLAFHKGTVSQAKAILKRSLYIGQTPDRPGPVQGTDGLCMYVYNNIHTDAVQLLKITPPAWAIREQTLVQIAESFPSMTAIEFRLSLAYLVEQAKKSKQPIRNHNAWVKAAFEKNGGPLITERDIEARFVGSEAKRHQDNGEHPVREDTTSQETRLLRLYLMCSAEERVLIDQLAEQKAAPLLKVVASEHRNGVLEEAKAEAVREYFRDKH